jgi:hypothetical protein
MLGQHHLAVMLELLSGAYYWLGFACLPGRVHIVMAYQLLTGCLFGLSNPLNGARVSRCSEYGGSFEAGAGTLRLYVHAVALARAAADAAQQAMEKEFQAIDALKERLQVGVHEGLVLWVLGCWVPGCCWSRVPAVSGVWLLLQAAGMLLRAVYSGHGCRHCRRCVKGNANNG